MTSEQDATYHRERAKAELDQAYRASHFAAAQAHMRLAALHMRRLGSPDLSVRSGSAEDLEHGPRLGVVVSA